MKNVRVHRWNAVHRCWRTPLHVWIPACVEKWNEMKSMSIEEQKKIEKKINLNEMPILYQNGMKKKNAFNKHIYGSTDRFNLMANETHSHGNAHANKRTNVCIFECVSGGMRDSRLENWIDSRRCHILAIWRCNSIKLQAHSSIDKCIDFKCCLSNIHSNWHHFLMSLRHCHLITVIGKRFTSWDGFSCHTR